MRAAEAAYAANRSVENEDRLAEARIEHAATDAGRQEIWRQRDALDESDPDGDRLYDAYARGFERIKAYRDAESQIVWEPKARSASSAARVAALRAAKPMLGNNLSDATLERLAGDPDIEVVKAAASYRGILPATAARMLAGHPDPEVRHALARSRGVWKDPSVSRILLAQATPADRLALAKWRRLPSDVVDSLAADPSAKVRATLLYDKERGGHSRPRSAVLRGLTDKSAKVRLAALGAWDSDAVKQVRQADKTVGVEVWKMPDPELVANLRNDNNEDVRGWAYLVFRGSEGKLPHLPGMPGGPAGSYREIE
ncbi:DUF2336 domain-containing protein [Pedococcus bigeumensis]|uniref:DUF2336 domain-containing protein n=1 Tax=Pedococcus bigeumensis TaxID=433644 RepID=UPI00112C6FE3|nr:DUF2336 domain-containing protein [Pedococcus bigeumensis]